MTGERGFPEAGASRRLSWPLLCGSPWLWESVLMARGDRDPAPAEHLLYAWAARLTLGTGLYPLPGGGRGDSTCSSSLNGT